MKRMKKMKREKRMKTIARNNAIWQQEHNVHKECRLCYSLASLYSMSQSHPLHFAKCSQMFNVILTSQLPSVLLLHPVSISSLRWVLRFPQLLFVVLAAPSSPLSSPS